jgi:hypothetical protein
MTFCGFLFMVGMIGWFLYEIIEDEVKWDQIEREREIEEEEQA